MLPEARIEHQVHGRIRFRIPSKRGDQGYFSELERSLASCQGIASVRVNPTTGSVLVLHHASPDAIVSYAHERSLFQPATVLMKVEKITESICAPFLDLDSRIQRLSEGRLDLRGSAVLGLAALSVAQMLRHRVWPAGGTLLWYAVMLLTRPQAANGSGEK
ncbi:MAG: HMA2 domain-containing protein [Bryobacteraceae bacterium]